MTGDTKLVFKALRIALVIKRVVPNMLNQVQPSRGHTLLRDCEKSSLSPLSHSPVRAGIL